MTSAQPSTIHATTAISATVFAATHHHTQRMGSRCGSSAATMTSVAGVAPAPPKYTPVMAIITSPAIV